MTKFIPAIMIWFNKRAKDLWTIVNSIQFWTSLLATIIGVLAAFSFNQYEQKKHIDDVTAQRLHLVFLESQFNGTTAFEVFEVYSKSSARTTYLKRTDPSQAITAIQDQNIFSFLPPYKLSILLSYIDAQKTLNKALEIDNDYLLISENIESKQEIVSNIIGNAASAIAMSIMIQEEFKLYFDDNLYDHDKIHALETKIKTIKNDILSRKIKETIK